MSIAYTFTQIIAKTESYETHYTHIIRSGCFRSPVVRSKQQADFARSPQGRSGGQSDTTTRTDTLYRQTSRSDKGNRNGISNQYSESRKVFYVQQKEKSSQAGAAKRRKITENNDQRSIYPLFRRKHR